MSVLSTSTPSHSRCVCVVATGSWGRVGAASFMHRVSHRATRGGIGLSLHRSPRNRRIETLPRSTLYSPDARLLSLAVTPPLPQDRRLGHRRSLHSAERLVFEAAQLH